MSETKRAATGVNVPVRLTEDLDREVTEASTETGLSKQDVMRLAIARGVKILIAQLKAEPPTPAATA
jgi:hypothetical protein